MRKWILPVVCALLAGCDYTVSLVDKPDAEIDRTILGLWQRTNEEAKVEDLVILPLGDKEYMISYPTDSGKAMYARGCLARVDDLALVQLTWFGNSDGGVPDDGKVYQYVTYAVDGDVLSFRLLNDDVVGKDAAASLGMAAAIREKKGEKDLFEAPMAFRKAGE